MIHKRFDNQKKEEQFFTTCYIENKYNFIPKYIKTKSDVPDCYFEYDGKYYAVEVTSYFQQRTEQQHQEFGRTIEKYLNRNFFEQIQNRLGKKKPDDVTISFYNYRELESMIINNINYIEYISVDKNVFYNGKEDSWAIVPYAEKNENNMKIEDYINYVHPLILAEKNVTIDIPTKNKYDVSIEFKYCKIPYYGKDNDKKVIESYCSFINEEELYGNIINAIVKKNNKLISEYIPILNNNKIKYDFYNLVVYNEGYPANLNEKELYDQIKTIKDLRYDEIAIFLWNKIMLVTKEEYKTINKY